MDELMYPAKILATGEGIDYFHNFLNISGIGLKSKTNLMSDIGIC